MCTALTYQTKDFYFGRNLDLHLSYNETVTVTPRSFPLQFRCKKTMNTHYAMIGVATVAEDYPLYYDATNEKGLSIAGLNFPGNAVYYSYDETMDNIAPFELIPWILGQCATVTEALKLIKQLNLWNTPFNAHFPLSPLHWILADKRQCLVLEPMADGLKVHDNPVGVLTNNPPFDYHMYHLADYMNVTANTPQNHFSNKISLTPYSLGMGGIGLPGDLSSSSRFVKAAFTKLNSICRESEPDCIGQFFHILGSVAQQKGLTAVSENDFEYTVYSSCCNTDKGLFYYTTYENSQISCIDMHKENLDNSNLVSFPLIRTQQIYLQNGG